MHFLLPQVNNTLKELHLQKCYVTDWGCERLAEALEHNSSLKLLDLSRSAPLSLHGLRITCNCAHTSRTHSLACARSNLITRDGSKALARALQTNTSLELLDLGSCSLEDEGAQNLAACLVARNRTLRMCAAPCFLRPHAFAFQSSLLCETRDRTCSSHSCDVSLLD